MSVRRLLGRVRRITVGQRRSRTVAGGLPPRLRPGLTGLGRRLAGVAVVTSFGIAVGALSGALPAAAHTEVEVEPAVGGATNAKVTFDAEAESNKAGITSVKVTLPPGLVAADVALASGPSGWTLAADADGYAVTGPALRTGANAKHTITVKQLPNTPTVVFKVLVTYSDGRVDRWIEVPSAANPKPDNPAAVATLRAPPEGFGAGPSAAASSTPPAAASPSATATASDVAPPVVATHTNRTGGGSAWPWIVAVLVVLSVLGGAGFVWYRRRATPTTGDA